MLLDETNAVLWLEPCGLYVTMSARYNIGPFKDNWTITFEILKIFLAVQYVPWLYNAATSRALCIHLAGSLVLS